MKNQKQEGKRFHNNFYIGPITTYDLYSVNPNNLSLDLQ